jgi:hypothetical protein
MKRKYLNLLGFLLIGVLIGAIKYFYFESEADKKADHAAILEKTLKFAGAHDSSGLVNRAVAFENLMSSLFLACKKIVVPSNPNATLTDDDKNKYCGCVMFGANKLYFSTLSDSELIAQSQLDPKDQSPVAVRKKVFADCSQSVEAYQAPHS